MDRGWVGWREVASWNAAFDGHRGLPPESVHSENEIEILGRGGGIGRVFITRYDHRFLGQVNQYIDRSVMIHAVKGAHGGKALQRLEDGDAGFFGATFLKLELLPQPTFFRRVRELAFLEEYFRRVVAWEEARSYP